MLKKIVLVGTMLLVATNLWADKVVDVSATRHNFGTTSSFGDGIYRATDEDEVCIYCHTPHGGALNTPMWNRTIPSGAGFTHFSSATLSGYFTDKMTRVVNPESLLCMSCHDGSISINSITNSSNRTGADPDFGGPVQPMWFVDSPGAVIGEAAPYTVTPKVNDLSDDHPISFSYSGAQGYGSNSLKLHPADGSLANDPRHEGGTNLGVRLFGPNLNVECSTCHDPHVNGDADSAYSPFLVMPSTGSALCLACHIK